MSISAHIESLARQIAAKEQANNQTIQMAADRIAAVFAGRSHRMDEAMSKLKRGQVMLTQGAQLVNEARAEMESLEMEAGAEALALGADLLVLKDKNTPRAELEAVPARGTPAFRIVGDDAEAATA